MENKEVQLTPKEVENKIKEEIESYRQFAFKDDLLKTVVAFTVVTMLNKMLMAFTESFVMPFIKLLIGGPEKTWATIKWEPIPGLIFEVGKFLGATVEFMIISFILYIIWVKILKKTPVDPTQAPPKKRKRR